MLSSFVIHQIHDLSNTYISSMISEGLREVEDEDIKANYHPEHSDNSGNLFYRLNNQTYQKGCYVVVECDGQYVASAGWSEYDVDTALISRMYVMKQYRNNFIVGENILPIIIDQTKKYKYLWASFNKYNKGIVGWMTRNAYGWPDVYKRFAYLGLTKINNVDQYVFEYERV